MFRKKDDAGSPGPKDGEGDMSAPPLKPFSKRGSHTPPKLPSKTTFTPTEAPRRAVELPSLSAPRRLDRPRLGDADSKRLTVGREICLSGEITCCDKLVVEGRVEATLSDARAIEVASSGYFKGRAVVNEADISGRYEGDLIAHDRLVVRAGGLVTGSIRYGRIIIESGGRISGDMQALADVEGADEPPVPQGTPSTF
ncbi:MAG: polymer-forming cytoskeletal protein [Magnetospirillum sp. WYHS-4]